MYGGISIPKHLTDIRRELFIMIVNELAKAGVALKPSDAISIEMLTTKIARVRASRRGRRVSSDEEETLIYDEIGKEAWEEAMRVAHDLMLPFDALKRMTWEQ